MILFVGGGIGAVLRFSLALWVDSRAPSVFPWGTLAVNILGCFLIGLIATLADEHRMLSPSLRLLIVPGILGGFTTFSTFGLETWRLIEDGLALAALGNAAASLVGGLAAIALAILVGRALG